jgi:putative transposase
MYLQSTTSYGSLIPGAEYIRSLVRQGTISLEAAKRLRWLDHYAHHKNARLTCRYFGISPQTFYRWKRRFDPYDLTTLEEESRRPLHVRQPQTPAALVERILQLRQQYPRWGKDKLAVLLKREGQRLSASSVGRVLSRLKKRGVLVEPLNVRLARAARKRRWKPRYAVRKPPGWRVDAPGDLVQLDTLQIKLRNGTIRWQFSARDVICRWDRARAFSRPTSFAASFIPGILGTKVSLPHPGHPDRRRFGVQKTF